MTDLIPGELRAELVRTFGALTLTSERDGAVHVIALSGEVDVANAAEFEQDLRRVEATDAAAVIVDLSKLEFIDSTGLRVLIMADARSRADSNRLSLLRPPAGVFRVFVISGIAERLPFAD